MIDAVLRKLPAFRGKQRVARFLLQEAIRNSNDIVVEGKYGCKYKLPNVKENIGFEILVNGIYEEDTIDFIVSKLKPGKIFMDVGANIGAVSIPVYKRCADTKVIAIEAAPWIFNYLQENADLNSLTDYTLLNNAITDEGQKEINFFSPREKYGKGSLASVFTSESVAVKSLTLDDVIDGANWSDIGLIKIDIEGFEYQAFAGGGQLLNRPGSPEILFEFVDWAEDQVPGISAGSAQKLLMEYGYEIYVVDRDTAGDKLTDPLTRGSCMLFATSIK